jgi:hypothetical protein
VRAWKTLVRERGVWGRGRVRAMEEHYQSTDQGGATAWGLAQSTVANPHGWFVKVALGLAVGLVITALPQPFDPPLTRPWVALFAVCLTRASGLVARGNARGGAGCGRIETLCGRLGAGGGDEDAGVATRCTARQTEDGWRP